MHKLFSTTPLVLLNCLILAEAGATAPAVAPLAPAQSAGPSTAVLIGALVIVVLALLFLYRMVTRKDTPANPAVSKSAPKPAAAPAVPPGFDSAAFLRQAKASFARMQAAWDKADTHDLSQFTTPQVFTELQAQMAGRVASGDVTEVVSIKAKLLGVDTVGDAFLASVRFEGMIKPGRDAQAEPFAEVWNMSRPRNGSSAWMLAGIQQLS